MSRLPGLGIAKGMALTLRKFFEPKATIKYPEVRLDVPPRFRGRLQLLYDEYGTLKCETCFQCAQACPIECIDMGGVDTKGRYHIHWGAPETYGERRDESALRRSGRPVPDRARSAVFSAIPDAVLVSGTITGEAAAMGDLAAVKRVLPTTPVLANTGVKHATVADVLAVADGCIVGSALKVGGDTWAAVDPARAADFMDRVRAVRR